MGRADFALTTSVEITGKQGLVQTSVYIDNQNEHPTAFQINLFFTLIVSPIVTNSKYRL